MKVNGLINCHYVEPFAGGCGLAVDLLFSMYAMHIHLNDLDPAVYNFWKAVVEDCAGLCGLIEKTPVTIDEWFRQKEIFSSPVHKDPLLHAFSTLFLNRTNRSGILLGGVIGGKNQTGNYKLDARFNKKEIIKKLDRIFSYRHRIHLSNKDAKDFLTDEVSELPEKTLIYLDPPYYVKGGNLYQNHYKPSDHEVIASTIQGLKNRYWLVSYDSVPEIELLYSACNFKRYELNYSARNHVKGTEVMFFSDGLVLPEPIKENP